MSDAIGYVWEVLPAYVSEPNQPLLGVTIDNGASYTIVAQLKSEWRAKELADTMNNASDMLRALREIAQACDINTSVLPTDEFSRGFYAAHSKFGAFVHGVIAKATGIES